MSLSFSAYWRVWTCEHHFSEHHVPAVMRLFDLTLVSIAAIRTVETTLAGRPSMRECRGNPAGLIRPLMFHAHEESFMVVTLDDKYTLTEGQIYLTGIQALVRLPMDQQRRQPPARPQEARSSGRHPHGDRDGSRRRSDADGKAAGSADGAADCD